MLLGKLDQLEAYPTLNQQTAGTLRLTQQHVPQSWPRGVKSSRSQPLRTVASPFDGAADTNEKNLDDPAENTGKSRLRKLRDRETPPLPL